MPCPIQPFQSGAEQPLRAISFEQTLGQLRARVVVFLAAQRSSTHVLTVRSQLSDRDSEVERRGRAARLTKTRTVLVANMQERPTMSGTFGPMPQPFQVDVLPSGFSDSKDKWNFVIAVLTTVFTFSVPCMLWWYDKRQEQRQAQLLDEQQRQQQQLAAQQRLQGHVALLSDTGGTAMSVIGTFKLDCEAIGLVYTDVFRDMREVQGAGVTITRQQLQQVNTARSRLQGMWDNIMDDYRDGGNLLGGPITDRRHGKMLRRGLTYMELVEPLEAANYARLQLFNKGVAEQGPYLLPEVGSPVTQQPDSLVGAPIRFRSGARPARFKWLENQKTLQQVGRELWAKDAVPHSHKGVSMQCFHLNGLAAVDLGASEQQQWRRSLIRHWECLQQACRPILPAAPPQPSPPAAPAQTQQVPPPSPSVLAPGISPSVAAAVAALAAELAAAATAQAAAPQPAASAAAPAATAPTAAHAPQAAAPAASP